ncbi:phosphate ABC transporter substrate-binding protein [Microvirga tunisiensis]|uniref:Phosphate ABC transporter substrate-binding protein n=2 Tax=Pannonibacter tanglangensis TaxID=2750084 RepID=A0ABW9ZML8_9HYPH|nr:MULTISPECIES: substrate-binding domain-containing protein [unclassified Pannonibacter]NBN64307.1 phosphate ABC transporter substrate-binding protein [Pannonibacter sp. XCT-34]NBN78840.1 phosphate ABC transporter substrate-binding protein [Pannonibacter sp. XCT-53]
MIAALCLTSQAAAFEREQLQIVGSSTVFPFAKAVAERFGMTGGFRMPVVESTGTGAGMELFCAGTGAETPDITNASRAMKPDEARVCALNGVTPIELKIGFDGIVLAGFKDAPDFNLALPQLFLALAARVPVDGRLVDNPYRKWSDISADLPDSPIQVFGPPPTSGTRDAFSEMALEAGCARVPDAAALGLKGKACHAIREDGVYLDTGENDELVVQLLDATPTALGIFGFSFLNANLSHLKGARISGIEPTFTNIAYGAYPLSRALYVYFKKEHAEAVPGMPEYLTELTREQAWGPGGYLKQKGLIPLPDAERVAQVRQVETSFAGN